MEREEGQVDVEPFVLPLSLVLWVFLEVLPVLGALKVSRHSVNEVTREDVYLSVLQDHLLNSIHVLAGPSLVLVVGSSLNSTGDEVEFVILSHDYV